MIPRRIAGLKSSFLCLLPLSLAAATPLCAVAGQQAVPATTPSTAPTPSTAAGLVSSPISHTGSSISLDSYRKHLRSLIDTVDACAKQRGDQACDPENVGQDDRIALPASAAAWAGSGSGSGSGSAAMRDVHYDWLRDLLTRAQKPDAVPTLKTTAKPVQSRDASGNNASRQTPNEDSPLDPDPLLPPPPNEIPVSTLLQEARRRLEEDWAQAEGAPERNPASATSPRQALDHILSAKEYRQLSAGPTWQDKALETFSNWFNQVFGHLHGVHSRWVGWMLEGLLVLAVSVGLAWFLIRMDRQLRLRAIPSMVTPGPGAASARDWQLWLDDAGQAAAAGQWREAIHFVYWAAISRLESKKLWPADRARTPREYLALVPIGDERRASLEPLTRSFEHTWYGGRAATGQDFHMAADLAAQLGAVKPGEMGAQ